MFIVSLGDECIVGALNFIGEGQIIEPRSLLVGNPYRKFKELSDEMMVWKTAGTKLYQALPAEMHAGWHDCEPLLEVEGNRLSQEVLYQTWNSLLKGK